MRASPLTGSLVTIGRVPFFNWNPPARDSLVASCKNDIDDQVEIDDFVLVDSLTQNDTDCGLPPDDGDIQVTGGLPPDDGDIRVTGGLPPDDGNIQVTGNSQTRDNDVAHVPVVQCDRHVHTDIQNDNDGSLPPDDGNIQVTGGLSPDDGDIQVTGNSQTHDNDFAHVPAVQCDRHVHTNTQNDTDCDLPPDNGDIQVIGNSGGNIPHTIPKGITKITKLTLELFNNNYHLYAQKINHPEEGLFIRAILMKNNAIFFNYTYKIIGTSNVAHCYNCIC